MTKTRTEKISLIIPCFNEEGNVALLYEQIKNHLDGYRTEYIFVDDCSRDNTLSVIRHLASEDSSVKYLSFSRNFGHQYAIRAGLEYATGDCAITIDADLQHPPELITSMVDKWKEGYDIVFTVRNDFENVPLLKRISASVFYKFLNFISDIDIKQGSADFRLLDKRIVKILVNDITEYHLFYRGMISWLGFKQAYIEYIPNKRYSGESKYSLSRMISFAIDGITSFSIKPLKIATLLGLLLSSFSGIYGVYAIIISVFTDKALTGWTSLILSILFVGGVNMVLLGIIGEYIGKLYIQSKRRPLFLVKVSNIKTDE